MTAPLWVGELAGAFWRQAGGAEPFPRALREPIARCGLDLTIIDLKGLGVRAVERYLAVRGVDRPCAAADRPLRACLVACAGAAFVFLDAGDEPAEQAFSLAHELAHFLRDCWQPRRRAVAALGEAVLEILDGERPPRPHERLHGVLRGVPLGCHVHLMERDGAVLSPRVAAAERDADRLACELLAPEAEVRRRLPAGAAEAEALLREAFGLPAAAATAYAETLFPLRPPADPLTARLKKVVAARRTSAGSGEQQTGGHGDER